MSNFLTIPKLTRSSCCHIPASLENYVPPSDINELFEQYTGPHFKSSIDPLENLFGESSRLHLSSPKENEFYDVDDTPLPEEDGVLRLKMPITRQPTNEIPVNTKTPLCQGASVHMGYQPITEEEAFKQTVSDEKLQASHFILQRGQMTVDQIIDRIRNVVFATNDIHEIVPKSKSFTPVTEPYHCLYGSTLLYATFDEYGNHRFAEFHIRIQALLQCDSICRGKEERGHNLGTTDSFAVVATHFQGDTRLSMEFFQTLREYVLSNGKTECKVRNPDFCNGFADQYIDDMSEPYIN